MMMISIPPDLRYRNLDSLVREPANVGASRALLGPTSRSLESRPRRHHEAEPDWVPARRALRKGAQGPLSGLEEN